MNSLPVFYNGILYFGQGPEVFNEIFAGSRNIYSFNLIAHDKVTFPDVLHKTAFAVDAKTGKTLWKIRLDGGDESYIEKIMPYGNMVLVKSVAGWLYALEMSEPASAKQADSLH